MEAKAKIQSILAALSKEELINLCLGYIFTSNIPVEIWEEIAQLRKENKNNLFTDEYKALLDKRIREIETGKAQMIPIHSAKSYIDELKKKAENEQSL